MTDLWQPLGSSDSPEEPRILLDGVPAHLMPGVLRWLRHSYASDAGHVRSDFLINFGNVYRKDMNIKEGWFGKFDTIRDHIIKHLDDIDLLNLLDYSLSNNYRSGQLKGSLNTVLTEGGSKYEVGTRRGKPGLVVRVAEGVRLSFEDVLNSGDLASAKLEEAWSKAYGLNPSPADAYAAAVKSVEIIAVGTVTPQDGEGTLGKVISVMEQQGGWGLPLRDSEKAPAGATLISMMRVLWRGQKDRHGSPTYQDVSQTEAQTAVLLAATLVGWFTSGSVVRSTK